MLVCEKRGQELPPMPIPFHNTMTTYVDPSNGKVDGIYNEEDDIITVKGKKLQSQESYNKAKLADAHKKVAEEIKSQVSVAKK